MRYVAYRNLIGVSHTEAQAKAEAEAIMVHCLIQCSIARFRYQKTFNCR